MKAGKLNLLNADILIYKAAFPRHFNQLDGNAFDLLYCQCFGEMSERLKVPVLKTLSPPLKADTQNGWRFFDFESGIRSER